MRGANTPNLAAMEQTRMLAHTLARNNDPKFQVLMLYYQQIFCMVCIYFPVSGIFWFSNCGYYNRNAL